MEDFERYAVYGEPQLNIKALSSVEYDNINCYSYDCAPKVEINCGDNYLNHNFVEKIRTKRELAVMNEVFGAKGESIEEKTSIVLNDWNSCGEIPYINETIVETNKKYKIRHHQRVVKR